MHIYRLDTPAGPQLVRGGADSEHLSALKRPGVSLQELIRGHADEQTQDHEPVSGRVLPPLGPGKIVAVGLNYLDHIREAGAVAPAQPLLFAKFPSVVIGHGEAIEFDPTLAQRVDWETELAVVIGREARNVSEKDALEYVFGYTIGNDVSARDLQFGDGQWIRGKNLDTFCPLGPGVVTADEIPDPNALAIRTRVNGRTVQDSSTAEMLFRVPALISYCSAQFTLHPGDLILTGTPWGCGEFAQPPAHLTDGDVVESEIEGIGVLTNPVRHTDNTSLRRTA